MINIHKEDDILTLEYGSDQSDNQWIHERLETSRELLIKNTFTLTIDNLIQDDTAIYSHSDSVLFKLGTLHGEYYKIDKDILSTTADVYIHNNLSISEKTFIPLYKISIFKIINKMTYGDIYIGGDHKEAIPTKAYRQIISRIPNHYELNKYTLARIDSVLRNYITTNNDYEESLNNYVNKKLRSEIAKRAPNFSSIELIKYEYILEKLKSMLKNESGFSENQWQNEILEIILLLYPKYIHVFKETIINDLYTKKKRKLDFLLVDASGNVDIIEIKKPFDSCIVTENTYRDNHIPLRELSGTVMQTEKYIFLMNKLGIKGEQDLTEKYKNELPDGFKIKIINPKAILIMGRDNTLSQKQIDDFEVIKRQYKNVIDIITYDDLIKRLEFTLLQLRKDNKTTPKPHN